MEAFLRVLLRRLLLGSRAVPLVLCEGCAEHQDVEEEARHHDGCNADATPRCLNNRREICNQSAGTQDSACSVVVDDTELHNIKRRRWAEVGSSLPHAQEGGAASDAAGPPHTGAGYG